MASPLVLERSARIRCSPDEAWTVFIDRLWKEGGGFGPRPRIVEPGDDDGIGCTRRIDVGLGAYLLERIEAGEEPTWLNYRVVNPGWRTYPVRRHRGEIRFDAAAPPADTERANVPETIVRWRVTADPLPAAGLAIRLLTRAVMSRYLAELQRTAAGHDEPATP